MDDEITDEIISKVVFYRLTHVAKSRPMPHEIADFVHGIEEKGRRADAGLDIWTGNPLKDEDLQQWARIKNGLQEEQES